MTASSRPLRTLDMTYIALFAVGVTVCSWISLPFPIPLTLQTFAVFLALLVLGGKRGTLSILTHLLMGAVGLPVFSGFRGGLGVLLGTTGGYILGFVLTAVVFRLLAGEGENRKRAIAACAVGLLLCYAFGTVWYMVLYARTTGPVGLGAALSGCVIPFLIPDFLKLWLAVGLSRRLRPLLH